MYLLYTCPFQLSNATPGTSFSRNKKHLFVRIYGHDVYCNIVWGQKTGRRVNTHEYGND